MATIVHHASSAGMEVHQDKGYEGEDDGLNYSEEEYDKAVAFQAVEHAPLGSSDQFKQHDGVGDAGGDVGEGDASSRWKPLHASYSNGNTHSMAYARGGEQRRRVRPDTGAPPVDMTRSAFAESLRARHEEEVESKIAFINAPEMKVMGVDLTHRHASVQLLVCVCGVMSFFLFNAVIQESIFRFEGFKFGWYLTFTQFLMNSAIAVCQQLGMRVISSEVLHPDKKDSLLQLPLPANLRGKPAPPLYMFAIVSCFLVSSMGFANVASGHVSYPTIMLFKSSKLVPVMLGGIVLLGRSYHWLEYVSAACLSIGLFILSVDGSSTFGFASTGVVLLCAALFCDAFVGNMQERVMTRFKCSDATLMLYSYGIGALYLAVFLVFSGQWTVAFQFGLEHPRIYLYILAYSLTSFCGVMFILPMIRRFGAFVAMTVTSCRKALSLGLSFILFPNEFSLRMAVAIIMIFCGIAAHIYAKNKDVIRKAWRRALSKRHGKTRHI